MMMIGQGPTLTCTVGVAFLTCALTTLSAAVHEDTSNIFQVTSGDRKFLDNDVVGAEKHFKVFMEKYEKKYDTREEYLHRLGIFAKNMIRAAKHQVLDPTAVHGVTPFSDLSEEEFEELYTGVRGGNTDMDVVKETGPLLEVGGLPESFDWREKGAVTEVKMQVNSLPLTLLSSYYFYIYLLRVILNTHPIFITCCEMLVDTFFFLFFP